MMARHPEIQRKAQSELDKVVGANRLPTCDDYKSLPYVRAIFLECARWEPVVPLGLPHCAVQDDIYENYLIPKGTVVFAVRD